MFIIDSINIVPVQQTKTYNVTSFRMSVTNITLFNSVSVSVRMFDENNSLVGVKNLEFSGDQYNQWTNNDQTLVDMVATTLGFAIAPEAAAAAAAPEETQGI